MRALASNLEASRTVEAPFPLKMFEPNVGLGPKAPPLPPMPDRRSARTATDRELRRTRTGPRLRTPPLR